MIIDVLRKGEDTTMIVTSRQLKEYLAFGSGTFSGPTVTPDTAIRIGTVLSCVRGLAESVGSSRCAFSRTRPQEGEGDRASPLRPPA
jgi:phage portal protein BeeE